MKALFVRESGAGYLLAALTIVSAILLVLELNTRLLEPVRSMLASVVNPLYLVAESPYLLAAETDELFTSRTGLVAEQERLERRLLELSAISQRFAALTKENERLRELLGSRQTLTTEVLVTEIIGVVPDPGTHQVIVDKGASAGAYVGQAVIDAHGLFGQVVEVGAGTSRVLLIADETHAVPVQVTRNGLRMIASGTGRFDRLTLEHVAMTADVRVGDLLVSSGLGGRFPRGYPVGKVISVSADPKQPFARVIARPLAQLDRSHHVLLLFAETEQVLP